MRATIRRRRRNSSQSGWIQATPRTHQQHEQRRPFSSTGRTPRSKQANSRPALAHHFLQLEDRNLLLRQQLRGHFILQRQLRSYASTWSKLLWDGITKLTTIFRPRGLPCRVDNNNNRHEGNDSRKVVWNINAALTTRSVERSEGMFEPTTRFTAYDWRRCHQYPVPCPPAQPTRIQTAINYSTV